jgi:hypothetical protein
MTVTTKAPAVALGEGNSLRSLVEGIEDYAIFLLDAFGSVVSRDPRMPLRAMNFFSPTLVVDQQTAGKMNAYAIAS